MLDSPQLNAFALPGGKVGVFTGMLQIMANEAQLATVLGHEVGHVNARHAAQRIVAENAVALALRLGASLLAYGDTPIPPQLVVALGGSLADVGLIRPFGRGQELQADELGLRYMARAGYDPGRIGRSSGAGCWRWRAATACRPSCRPIRPASAGSSSWSA